MWRLAIKDLFSERAQLFVSLGGVAAAIVLVLFLQGIVEGSAEQLVAYVARADADVWVMQEGVSNMHMASSTLPRRLEATLRSAPGVKDTTPILYASGFVEAGGQRWLSYIVGVPQGAPRGGPWAMARSVETPGTGQAVVPEALARKAGADIGETVHIMGREFQVVGLSNGTFSMANSVTFVSYADMESMLASPGAVSYLLVKAGPGVSPAALAERIRQAAPGVNAMPRDAFVESDRSMARQMGADLVSIMGVDRWTATFFLDHQGTSNCLGCQEQRPES